MEEKEQPPAGEQPAAGEQPETASTPEAAPVEETLFPEEPPEETPEGPLKAAIEAIVYATEEPATAAQIATALKEPEPRVARLLAELAAEYSAPERGVSIREIAGGYKVATKPEHHDAVRAFARSLKPPLKLSLAALETLAAIAYKQPITAPEIMAIRGVQGAGVLNTLLERKLIRTAGRKNVIGRPILYRTTPEFLVQFGLKDLSELPTLKEFEELRRLDTGTEGAAEAESEPAEQATPEPAAEEAKPEPLAAEEPAPEAPAEAPPAEELPPQPAAAQEAKPEPEDA